MSTIANSTFEGEEEDSLGTNTLKYILVTAIPVVVALCVAFVLVFVVRACWRKRQGSKEYRPVPTIDIPDHPNERPKKQVQIILPNPPPPKTKITVAPNLTESKLPHYLPHKSAATDVSCNNIEEIPPVRGPAMMGGVAALFLKIYVEYNHLMVEVQNAVGLPCRADGTSADPFVKLNVVLREEKQHVRRKSCSTNSVHHSTDPQFMETLDCGPVVREELDHSILHMEVLDNRSYSQHVVLAEADLALSQVKEKPAKSFKVPLNIVKLRGSTISGHVLISLYNDNASSKLSVTITKVELSLENPPSSTDYWVKVIIIKGEKCLVKEKAKHVSILSDQIHFNKSIVCPNISDVGSLSVQCSLVSMTTVNFMKRTKILGMVTLGSHVQGQALRHWNDMLNTPNTPIAEWHDLT